MLLNYSAVCIALYIIVYVCMEVYINKGSLRLTPETSLLHLYVTIKNQCSEKYICGLMTVLDLIKHIFMAWHSHDA